MHSFFSRLFGTENQNQQQPSSDTETVRRIIREIDQLPREDARYLAAFAFVLSRVANADLNISPEEMKVMTEIVQEVGGLTEAEALLVVQIAKSQQALIGGTENYLVTREFGKIARRQQREKLLHCLFEIAAADDEISLEEEEEIRRIASELGFDHQEFSTIRSKFNDKRLILR